jgi:hypothetical protein
VLVACQAKLAEGGKREHWGRVTAWEPPKRLVLAWHVNPERAGPTEIVGRPRRSSRSVTTSRTIGSSSTTL